VAAAYQRGWLEPGPHDATIEAFYMPVDRAAERLGVYSLFSDYVAWWINVAGGDASN
jgi:hypothetical protein